MKQVTADQVHPDLKDAVTRVLTVRRWTLRQAQIATNVPRSTIHRMSRGFRPDVNAIFTWAIAIEEPIEKWLRLADYVEIADELERSKMAVPQVAVERREPLDEDLEGIVAFYSGLPPRRKELFRSLLRELAADAPDEQDEETED